MSSFKDALRVKINKSIPNDFGADNFDEYRFGKYVPQVSHISSLQKVKNIVKKIIGYKSNPNYDIANLPLIKEYGDRLQYFYDRVDSESKALIVELIAYKILGFRKVKLSINTPAYWSYFEEIKKLITPNDTLDPHYKNFILKRFNLKPIGFNIDFYFTESGVVTHFLAEQYAYKKNNEIVVGVEKGDVVFDLGGCWGDTALYFADLTGVTGKVYTFEFIPENIKILNLNTNLNPDLKNQVVVVDHPASDVSDQVIYYLDNGPASKISTQPFDNHTGTTITVSIDDFVSRNNIPKVDFIKMDIEGAEPLALKGAINTIKKFKPKLAISIYHGMNDFVNIPAWLMELDSDYVFYVGHYKIFDQETVLFAKPRK